MQALRSLIACFVPAAKTVQTSAAEPAPLTAEELAQVAGGLPHIGGLCLDSALTQVISSAS